jgi:DNA-binding PadR family transcriptional regulator
VTRLFRRGELKTALLDALDVDGPANGYAVMQTLAERIGESWQPSPGAVYPALLALEDAGLVVTSDRDGSRLYELTRKGRQAARASQGTLDEVARRARHTPRPQPTLGTVVDGFASGLVGRARSLDEEQHRAVLAILDGTRNNIDRIIDKEI